MKKIVRFVLIGFCSVSTMFAQSYSEYLAKAKKYESQKKWCYALGAYYDAMGTDELLENKQEAITGFNTIKNEIYSGNPGIGKFNQFTMHDEWKNLLIDAEKYGSSNNMYEITIGELTQGDLDYSTRTATYNAEISYQKGSRYNNTIKIIAEGYKIAYKEDWKDLPEKWPLYSASSQKNNIYNVNGAFVYARDSRDYYGKEETLYLNAFAMFDNDIWRYKTPGLYDYKFNIVDENGKEVVKGKRWLLAESKQISFSGITPEVMDLIDNGKTFINPVACYLEYGKFNSVDDKGGRTFIKNFPEAQLPTKKEEYICGKNKENKVAKNVVLSSLYNLVKMVKIDSLEIEMLKTEVTQDLYEIVMNENPLKDYDRNKPIGNISWYDAICFCNRLSEIYELIPVYSFNGKKNISKKDFDDIRPYEFPAIVRDLTADGFRLPTEQEWLIAANNNLASFSEEYYPPTEKETHSVAQTEPNTYGLYDMFGNAYEWTWDTKKSGDFYRSIVFGDRSYIKEIITNKDLSIGFRIVRSLTN
ncbi:MAG: SUMF1/EgtB/PvdO family nonheme iron enzyme [Treponema sp.]|nr:SUMF1/EgtB/PvdO family nonheme iron enzyme [Treponema sp.]